jgi:hypothetical protein
MSGYSDDYKDQKAAERDSKSLEYFPGHLLDADSINQSTRVLIGQAFRAQADLYVLKDIAAQRRKTDEIESDILGGKR